MELCINLFHECTYIHPDNKKKIAALEALMKAFDIPFEVIKSPYNPEFVAKIDKSRQQVKKGEGRKIDIENL